MAFNIKRCTSLFIKRNSLTNNKVKMSCLISRKFCSNGILPIPRSWLKKEIQPKYHHQIEDLRPRLKNDDDEDRRMVALWQDLIEDLSNSMQLTSEVKERLIETVEYNLINQTNLHPYYKLLVRSYKLIATHKEQTDDNIRLAEILGWCALLSIENTIIEDDILDNGVLRGGKPTWYLKNNKDLISLKDGHLINQSVYHLLKIHFRDKPYYLNLIEKFHEVEYKTALCFITEKLVTNKTDAGRLLDFDNNYTMERWEHITSLRFAASMAPVKLAIIHAGIRDPEVFKRYNNIAKEIMKFLALTNDFVDCYGDPDKIGKSGTDIAEGSCSFLIAIALKHATPKQKKILQENYGFDDPQKISRVYQVYEDMNIVSLYCAIEKEYMNLINITSAQVSTQIPPKVFTDIIRGDLFRA